MDVFKRYFYSFLVASVILFVIAYYAEEYYEGQMPHNPVSYTHLTLPTK